MQFLKSGLGLDYEDNLSNSSSKIHCFEDVKPQSCLKAYGNFNSRNFSHQMMHGVSILSPIEINVPISIL